MAPCLCAENVIISPKAKGPEMAAWLKWHHSLLLPPLWLQLSACCPFLTPTPWLGRQRVLLGLLHTVDWQPREQKSDRSNNTLLILEMETVTSATFPAFISLNAIVQCLIFGVFAVLFPAANGCLDTVSPLYCRGQREER